VWRVGVGDIEDETGKAVGSMKRRLLPMRTEIQLLDSDGSVLCAVQRKTAGLNPVYDITDGAGKQLARAKKTVGGLKNFMRLHTANHEELLKATGSAIRWEFVISNPKRKGKSCATIRKTVSWERTSESRPDFEEGYVINIEDPETDRLLLLAYAVAISDTGHNV
jgi:uncharacterized protein YxjI